MNFHQTGKNEQHSLDSGSFETTYSVYCGYRKARLEIIGFPLPLRGLGYKSSGYKSNGNQDHWRRTGWM